MQLKSQGTKLRYSRKLTCGPWKVNSDEFSYSVFCYWYQITSKYIMTGADDKVRISGNIDPQWFVRTNFYSRRDSSKKWKSSKLLARASCAITRENFMLHAFISVVKCSRTSQLKLTPGFENLNLKSFLLRYQYTSLKWNTKSD